VPSRENVHDDFEPTIGCRTRLTPAACAGKDGFDDTFAIMTSGMIGGVTLTLLTDGLGRTCAKTAFVDSPIDNVLVGGGLSSQPFKARKLGGAETKPYGSDHYPVLVEKKLRLSSTLLAPHTPDLDIGA
jgi:hypothetical protein